MSVLLKHEKDYKPLSWKKYSLQELGNFVHLLAKRAGHRANPEKRKKDLYDAGNYLFMMGEILEQIKKELL